MKDIVVEIKYGKVRGAVQKGIYSFKGIPYGAPTGGKHRFLPPVPHKPWPGVLDVMAYGPVCPQVEPPPIDPAITSERVMPLPQSEDCLALNVWTPGLKDGGNRPVMVWLHGGGFFMGAGSDTKTTDGAALSKRGNVVVVTVNHRLHVLGYLHLADIAGDDYAGSGVAGMLDLVLALEWVRDNIEAFGGNPGNVTIFGESGGGIKVGKLLAMPSAKGLFHRAVIQSGASLRGLERRQGTELAERLLAELGLKANQIDKLQEIPPQKLMNVINSRLPGIGSVAQPSPKSPQNVSDEPATGNALFRFTPVVDGYYLPVHPFDPVAAPTGADVPLIIGTNKDENAFRLGPESRLHELEEKELRERLSPVLGKRLEKAINIFTRKYPHASRWETLIGISTLGDFRLPAIRLAERKAAGSSAPVYMYQFTWESDYGSSLFKACHSMDIPFVFDTVDDTPMTGDRPDKHKMAELMSEAWIAFARNGDPNHPGIPEWKPYTAENRATMLLDVPCRVEVDPQREDLDVWKDIDVNTLCPEWREPLSH
jgi:para-nitrobenzyl esterase